MISNAVKLVKEAKSIQFLDLNVIINIILERTHKRDYR